MIHVDHFGIGREGLYEASDSLRRETGLGIHDGGWFLIRVCNSHGLRAKHMTANPGGN